MTVRRVAFLSSEYPPQVFGGLGTTVEALSRFLGRTGVLVDLFVPAGPAYDRPPAGVTLREVPVDDAASDEDYWLTYCESVVAEARRGGLSADLVHGHDWMTAPAAVALGRMFHRPVLMSVHLPQSGGANLVMENVGLAGADGVLVNSLSVDAELADRGSVAAPVTVVPNGVDLDRFPAATMPPRPGRIAFAGRLVPQKGADVLLRAFGALLRRFPDAELVLAGDGVQRLYLERLARFLGVSRSVSFLGWQSPDELAEHYRSAAVAAVPSLYEPFGLVALEAMATGRPVVVSQVGGLAEILAGDVGGYTVTPGDHLDLATRLGALLADGNLAAAQGRAARRRAEDFGWDGIAERTRAVYDSLSCGPYCGDAVRMALDTAEPEVRDRIRRLIDEAG